MIYHHRPSSGAQTLSFINNQSENILFISIHVCNEAEKIIQKTAEN